MSDNMESISGRKQIRVKYVSIAQIFLLACVTGSVAIFVGVFFNSLALSVGLPVIVMGGYIYKAMEQQSDLPISIIGDSFYYLGFILTLVALVTSLMALAANESVNMNNVVGSFGAALLTTIIGLIARLVVTSFSIQAQERRERLETEIERSLTNFSEHLDSLTTGVVASIAKVHAQTEEALTVTTSRYDSVHKEYLEQYKKSMAEAEKRFYKTVVNLSKRIDEIEVSPSMLSQPLRASLDKIINEMERHNKSFSEVNTSLVNSNMALAGQFDKSSSVIQEYVDKLDSSLADSIEKQAENYYERLGEIGDGILKSLGDVKDLKLEAQDSINEKLSFFGAEIDSLVEGIHRALEPIQKSTQDVEQHGKQIAVGLDKLVDAGKRIDTMLESTNSATSKVLNIQSGLENLSPAIQELCTELKAMTEVSRDASIKINSAAEATEGSSVQVAKDISEVYRQLTIQIQAIKGAA